MNHNDVKVLQENILYKGFLTLKQFVLQHRLFRGGWSEAVSRELVLRAQVVAALPYDPILNQIVLIEQFRVGALEDKKSPWLTELVAGLVKPGEEYASVVVREVKEETDLEVLDILPIYEYWVSPGATNERLALFLARVDATKAGDICGLEQEHEDIKVHCYDQARVFDAVEDGRVKDAATILALQWLQIHLQEVRDRWPT